MERKTKVPKIMSLDAFTFYVGAIYSANEWAKGKAKEKDSIYQTWVKKCKDPEILKIVESGYQGKSNLIATLINHAYQTNYINLDYQFGKDKSGKAFVFFGICFFESKGFKNDDMYGHLFFPIVFHSPMVASLTDVQNLKNKMELPPRMLTKSTIKLFLATCKYGGSYFLSNWLEDLKLNDSGFREYSIAKNYFIKEFMEKITNKDISDESRRKIEECLTVKKWVIKDFDDYIIRINQ